MQRYLNWVLFIRLGGRHFGKFLAASSSNSYAFSLIEVAPVPSGRRVNSPPTAVGLTSCVSSHRAQMSSSSSQFFVHSTICISNNRLCLSPIRFCPVCMDCNNHFKFWQTHKAAFWISMVAHLHHTWHISSALLWAGIFYPCRKGLVSSVPHQ